MGTVNFPYRSSLLAINLRLTFVPRTTMTKTPLLPLLLLLACLAPALRAGPLLNHPPDIAPDFANADNMFFTPDGVLGFDNATGSGTMRWKRNRSLPGMLFNQMDPKIAAVGPNEYPKNTYAADPELPFSIEFTSPSTIRLRLHSSPIVKDRNKSLMFAAEPKNDPAANGWRGEKTKDGWKFTGARGTVFLREKPWALEIRDTTGRVLTQTVMTGSPIPFCFVRRSSDYSRSFAVNFSLSPGERIFGCGESFTQFDKRGQKLLLSTTDALGTEKPDMYKPVPFFLSSRGYGMFMHTSSPVSLDIGATDAGRNTIMVAEDEFDLFIFLGGPKDVIGAYTALTGRASMPPLWSFGLWMSRITYKSEQQTREIAAKLRANRIPCDVIHLDTGWFETEWQCDYEFSKKRFDDPKKMLDDLRRDNFRVSLWQIPYFTPGNRFFPEIVRRGLAVRDATGGLPAEDAVLDFSNPETVAWYQEKLAALLRLGVSAIKTDFGEAAPYAGVYASGKTGFLEHNLYPLRYQQAAADITRKITGDSIIWARAGWAGAQRNPVHWGGDAGKTFISMAATLRAGLSIGISGYSFWSHDIGGFGGGNDIEVYKNWVPFGMLTSHSRVHGTPPKEPWEFGEDFMDGFRRADEMRYRLMPYIYAQAKDCSQRGLPMLRALFIEFPDDPGAWLVDDAYLLGSSIYVAPLFQRGATGRDVYLPAGKWIDYQTGRVFDGGWHHIEAGEIPCVILVRDGAVIPRAALAQSTAQINWHEIELAVFAAPETTTATGQLCLPDDNQPRPLKVTKDSATAAFILRDDPFPGRVKWTYASPGTR